MKEKKNKKNRTGIPQNKGYGKKVAPNIGEHAMDASGDMVRTNKGDVLGGRQKVTKFTNK